MADETTTTTQTKLFDDQLYDAGTRAGEVAARDINEKIQTIAYDPKFQQGIADKIASAGANKITNSYGPVVLAITFVMGLGAGYYIAKRTKTR
jgi:hypothetical protein